MGAPLPAHYVRCVANERARVLFASIYINFAHKRAPTYLILVYILRALPAQVGLPVGRACAPVGRPPADPRGARQ